MNQLINLPTAFGMQSVSVDNIVRVESWMGGSKVFLKEVKDGNNVEILCSASQQQVLTWITLANNAAK